MDFVICPDCFEFNGIGEYERDKMEEFKRNLEKDLISKKFNFKKNQVIWLVQIILEVEKDLVRWKSIESREKTYRLIPEKGRSFHFYFKFELADLKIMHERIDNHSFVQLIRKGNIEEFRETILHGEKTGNFQNPFYSKKK